MKIVDLNPSPYNPRKITDQELSNLTASIREHSESVGVARKGFRLASTITVNKNGNRIVGGHQRVKALERLGQDWVHSDDITWVKITPDSAKEKALNISLNNDSAMGEWDASLGNVLAEIENMDKDLFSNLSFGDIKVPAGDGIEGEMDDDAVPWCHSIPCSTCGQLYQLGEHRLLCGDATKVEDIERLMDGEKADMVFTDPPYGMSAVKKSGVLSKKYKPIEGDSNPDVAKKSFVSLLNMPGVWWGANYYCSVLPDASKWLVWNKNNGASDQTDCELAWTNLKGVVRQFKQSSEKINRTHPAQKPISLIIWGLDLMSCKVILDPFLGSGSTLISCEKTKRKCYGMEIETHYCDVIRKRWAEFVHGEGCDWEALTPKL